MNDTIHLNRLIKCLELFNPEYKITKLDLLDALSRYNPDIPNYLEILGNEKYGIPIKLYIQNLKEIYIFDCIFEREELLFAIKKLDFYCEKFEKYGIAHGLCDCPKCKSIEHLLGDD